MQGVTSGSAVTASYEVGDDIKSSIVGQEIPVVVTANRLTKVFAVSESGFVIPLNAAIVNGSHGGDFGDYRFTMPNEALKIIVFVGDYEAVTGITLSSSSAEIERNEEITLEAKIVPENASVKNVVWSSSDESVATVKDGVVTGVGNGTATITAVTVDGEKKATCVVTVESTSTECEHSYVGVVTEPTCTAVGYTTYTCQKCGDKYIDDIKPARGHSYEDIVTEPTCTKGGYTTHTCTRCGHSEVGQYTDA